MNGIITVYFFSSLLFWQLIFHMNSYPKDIFYNHVKKFLSKKLMTTNSCQNNKHFKFKNTFL